MRLTVLAGLARRDDEMARLLRRCEDRALGLRLGPGSGATSAAGLWGGLKLAWVLGLRLRHPDAVGHSLALLQRADRGVGPRHRAIPTLHDTWLGLEASCLLELLQEEDP